MRSAANKVIEAGRPSTMMSVGELAERWNVNIKTIYTAIERGQLIALRLGRTIRIARSHVELLEEKGGLGARIP